MACKIDKMDSTPVRQDGSGVFCSGTIFAVSGRKQFENRCVDRWYPLRSVLLEQLAAADCRRHQLARVMDALRNRLALGRVMT
jgi:hypothetical protein